MKLKLWLLTLITLVIFSSSAYAEPNKIPIYRVYNPASLEHLYTNDKSEVNALSSQGWRDEGTAWYAYDAELPGPTNGWYYTGNTGVKRLYNPSVGEHLYTCEPYEIQTLTQKGWSIDFNGKPIFHTGDSFYAPYGVARLYNESLKRHLYTLNFEEEKALVWYQGWRSEGHPFNVFMEP